MQKNTIKRLTFSKLLINASPTQKIAYVGVITALCVVFNMFFEFKFLDVQFSLTLFFSGLTGVLLGSLLGFTACFIGDLVGFLFNNGGFAYMPWIGIAMGMVALVSGLIINGLNFKFKGAIYVKLAIVSVATLLICTIGINTTAFWILYYKGVPFFTYVFTRLFVSGQIYNSLVNYALLFVFVPIVLQLKIFNR